MLFHECKATRRKIFCYLIPNLASIIEFALQGAHSLISDKTAIATAKDSFPLLASMLPTRTKSAYFPLILSCLGTILFQAAHFLYLRHVAKRPYLSFRRSRIYGDPLNDTEILVTRVLSAAPTLFTMLLAFNETGDASVEMKTAGNVVAGLVVFGILVSMKRYVHEHYSFDYNISHNLIIPPQTSRSSQDALWHYPQHQRP